MVAQIMTDRHKAMAYLMYTEFDTTQQKIADFFNVTQGTISTALKDARFIIEIMNKNNELNELRAEVSALKQLDSGSGYIDI